jgi:serine/threonine protein kinase
MKAIPSDSGSAVQREIRLLRRLNHPKIIKLQEVLHCKRQGIIYLILEWASFGSFSKAIKSGLSENSIV